MCEYIDYDTTDEEQWFDEEVTCPHCLFEGTIGDLCCDRGGHHLTCPECKGEVM